MTVRRKEVTNKITQILKGTSSGTSYVQVVMVIVHTRFVQCSALSSGKLQISWEAFVIWCFGNSIFPFSETNN